MNWIWFALISVIAFSSSALLQRVVMKEENSDPVTSSVIFQLTMAGITLVFALFMGFNIPSVGLIPYFMISAVLYAFGTLFFFRAAKELEASELSILAGSGALVTIAASYVFLGERFTGIQLLGVLLILLAVVIVNVRKEKIVFKKGIWMGLLGNTCYALAVVSDGLILRNFDTFSFLAFMNILPATILILAFPQKFPRLIHDVRHINRNLLAYSAVYVIAAETFYYPLKIGALVSQMSTILKATTITTVLLAMIFLNEKSHPWKKLIGAILTTVGILLIR